ncbi:MAG TPA: GNAT family N-acetyltransferase [Ferruginibacter sp.]|nr:GNAT family N-acetyltransferase [Ferruginibacter sp.]
MDIEWTFKKFAELNSKELYTILKLRNEVFVIEQDCIYQDADDKDQLSWHLMGWDGKNLAAYTRIIPPGISYEQASIGRVVTSPRYRKTGLGRTLMQVSIARTFDQFNTHEIKIGAQVYLTKFYGSLGFRQYSEPYLEDGIPHIEMILVK